MLLSSLFTYMSMVQPLLWAFSLLKPLRWRRRKSFMTLMAARALPSFGSLAQGSGGRYFCRLWPSPHPRFPLPPRSCPLSTLLRLQDLQELRRQREGWSQQRSVAAKLKDRTLSPGNGIDSDSILRRKKNHQESCFFQFSLISFYFDITFDHRHLIHR